MYTLPQIVEAVDHVKEQHGVKFELKNEQLQCIQHVANGQDVFATLPTGFGRTLIYTLLPSVLSHLRSEASAILLVSPLKELVKVKLARLQKANVSVICVTDKQSVKAELNSVKKGDFQVLLVSPEVLGTRKMHEALRDDCSEKIQTIVVDEAHCMDKKGHDYKEEYSVIGTMRSLMTHAPVLAITATAPPAMRKSMLSSLAMYHEVVFVSAYLDRFNITYQCFESPPVSPEYPDDHAKICFQWLVDTIRTEGRSAGKTIIYCRNLDHCGNIYMMVMNQLGDAAYIGEKCFNNRLVGMAHCCVGEKHKDFIMKEFVKESSIRRLLIVTADFAIGMSVPDVKTIIHYGAPRSMLEFSQELGRTGCQPGLEATSIMMYRTMDTTLIATDLAMQTYCRNPHKQCLRSLIQEHVEPDAPPPPKLTPHKCCSVCAKACDCGDPHKHWTQPPWNDATGRHTPKPIVMDAEKREELISRLTEFASYQEGPYSFLGPALMNQFTESVIKDIVDNVQNIQCELDLQNGYGFDYRIASEMLELIYSVVG